MITIVSKRKMWFLSFFALLPWVLCAMFVAQSAVIWLLLGFLLNAAVLYRVSLVVAAHSMPPKATSTLTQREHNEALVKALAERAAARQAQAQAVEHLDSGLNRLDESRQEAELAVIKAGESVKRIGALQRAQYKWIEEQVAPRLSRNGSMPETVKVINKQVETEVQRLVMHLQFQDVLDQKLNKVAGADIGAAILALTERTTDQQSDRKSELSAEHRAQRNKNKGMAQQGQTITTITPVRRGVVELF